MLRWQTAGESHGEALVAMIEGLPAGIHVTTEDIVGALARRRLGYGRGARMKFEQDKVRMLTGVRFGETIGSPVAIEIANTEWPKWTEVMSADPLDHDIPREGRNAPLSRPRPGHADLTGMRKYGFDDARPVLERSMNRRWAYVPSPMCCQSVVLASPTRRMRCCRSLRTSKHWTLRRCAHWIRRPNSR